MATNSKPAQKPAQKQVSKLPAAKASAPMPLVKAPRLQSTLSKEQEEMALAIEEALVSGNVGDLPVEKRTQYVAMLCKSLALNALTKPFIYIKDDSGKLMLYATRDCSEQLRKRDGIVTKVKERKTEVINDCPLHIVTVTATNKEGREDESIGVVSLFGYNNGKSYPLVGDRLANALMKAETKGKRRVTLSIAGLGIPDETEAGWTNEPLGGEVLPETLTPEERVKLAGQHALENGAEESEEVIEARERALAEQQRQQEEENAASAGDDSAQQQTHEEGQPIETGVTEDNYKEVICHVGIIGGSVRDKPVGKLPLPLIDMLITDWYPKAVETSMDDCKLAVAIHLRKKELEEAAAAQAKPAAKSAEPGPFGDETPAVPAKSSTHAPAAESKIDWRTVGIPVPCAIKGQLLGKQDDPHLRSLQRQVVPRIKSPNLLEQQFIDAVAAACYERGLDCDAQDFAYWDEATLAQRIGEKLDDMALTLEQGEEYLREVAVLKDNETLQSVGPELLLYIWQNWLSIQTSIRGKLAPMTPRTGKKK